MFKLTQEISGTRCGESVSLLLAGCLYLLPFLLPYHQPPMLSFQAEWLAAALGCATTLAAVQGSRNAPVIVPTPTLCMIAFALLLAFQAASNLTAYVQSPLLGALYALYAALMIWLGADLAANQGRERAATVLASCLLAGALANAAAGGLQFYGLPDCLKGIVAELGHNARHNGAYGNIAQPNLYANYLALGMASLAYLWSQRRLRPAYALIGAVALACGSALSGSRTTLLYAAWFALLGLGALGKSESATSTRYSGASLGLAGVLLVAQFALPWLNGAFHLGPAYQGAFERMADITHGPGEVRWMAWLLALRAFAEAPLLGVGMGEFAGTAFRLGMDPAMTRGEVWQSPHNLPLHLLAETGLLGAGLVMAALLLCCRHALRSYRAAPQPALVWIIAAVGIEFIHSLVEFPLWSAHFLGLTALLLGLVSPLHPSPGRIQAWVRPLAAAVSAGMALGLGLLLHDYLRLDATRATGAFMTMASAQDQARDRAALRELSDGILAPLAERWIFLGANLDKTELAYKLELSARVARAYPASVIVVRRAIFLALDGQAAEARTTLSKALRTFPHRCRDTLYVLAQAQPADATAIQALIEHTRANGCS